MASIDMLYGRNNMRHEKSERSDPRVGKKTDVLDIISRLYIKINALAERIPKYLTDSFKSKLNASACLNRLNIP